MLGLMPVETHLEVNCYLYIARAVVSVLYIYIAVGQYCEYRNQLKDRSNEFDTFDAYKETLELFCLEGTPGQFTWTPDQNTPDVVYYQVCYSAYIVNA